MSGTNSSWRLTSDMPKADCPSVAKYYIVCLTHKFREQRAFIV